MHGILKNFFNKMVDSKIYFNFSIWKNKPQNKKPNYIHIYSVNIFRALTLGNIVSLQLYDNTVYATIRFRQTIASAVIQTPWFYISVHKKKIDIFPALCFLKPLPVRSPVERASTHAFRNFSFEIPTAAILEVTSFPDPNLNNEKFAV